MLSSNVSNSVSPVKRVTFLRCVLLLIVSFWLQYSLPACSWAAKDNYNDFSGFPKWRDVMRAEALPKASGAAVVTLDTLEKVNAEINEKVEYADDGAAGTSAFFDRWQSRRLTMQRKRGDCEDYAITKYYRLIELGVPVKNMYLITGYYKKPDGTTELHTALYVKVAGDGYVLDLRWPSFETDELIDASKYFTLRMSPAYGINHQRWIRGADLRAFNKE